MAYTHVHGDDPFLGNLARKARLTKLETGEYWDWVGGAFAAPGSVSFADSTIALTEDANTPGRYTAAFTGVSLTGQALVEVFDVIPASPVWVAAEYFSMLAGERDEIGAIDTALTTAHGAGIWGAEGLTPVELIDVADQFTWHLGRRSGGRVTAEEKVYIQANETVRLAFDFSRLLAANVVPNSVIKFALQAGDDPNGVTFADSRVAKQGALAKATGVTAGEYVVRCKITTQYGDAIEGDGKLVVVA